MSVADQDELALKREQLEQVKTEIEAKLETSRIEWTRAIREGYSSNREYTAFINSYEARCNRLRGLFAKNGSLNGHSRPNQSPNLFTREGVRRIATNTVVGLQPGVFVRIFQETLRPSYRLGKDMRDRKDNGLCFHDTSGVCQHESCGRNSPRQRRPRDCCRQRLFRLQ
jgi:hypothetical protein